MERLTFEIDDEAKREFKAAVARDGETVRSVLTALCRQYIEFGAVDVTVLQAQVERLTRLAASQADRVMVR